MDTEQKMKQQYLEKGFYLYKNAIEKTKVEFLIEKTHVFASEINHYGIRNLMERLPEAQALAFSSPLIHIAKDILGQNAAPVRSIFFDKTPDANWNVPWHQDTSIAVKEKVEFREFGPWSIKQGIVHVEPPEAYLANILTLRIHLDITDKDNGALRVIPGSHRLGRVRSTDITRMAENSEIAECAAMPGDMLLMNPLLFHTSRKAWTPKHRRVIHIEYSAMDLPAPLQWHEHLQPSPGNSIMFNPRTP